MLLYVELYLKLIQSDAQTVRGEHGGPSPLHQTVLVLTIYLLTIYVFILVSLNRCTDV